MAKDKSQSKARPRFAHVSMGKVARTQARKAANAKQAQSPKPKQLEVEHGMGRAKRRKDMAAFKAMRSRGNAKQQVATLTPWQLLLINLRRQGSSKC